MSAAMATVLTAPMEAVVQHREPNPWTRLVQVLVEAGTTRVFGLPDDDMQSQHALEAAGIGMRWSTRQSSAVHMAAGAARTGTAPGVCVVGRGPAVAALVPGLLEAFHAHVPLVVLAAGTAADRRGTGAFQDAPTVEMMAPVTKWAARLSGGPGDADLLRRALALAAQAPAGPVYLEVPDAAGLGPGASRRSRSEDATGIQGVLEQSERPLLLIGGGAADVPRAELVRAAVRLGAGVVSTASGRGIFPESHPNYLGLAGLYMGTPVARTVNHSDVVLSLGSSLEETALTGMPLQAEWIQINAHAADIRHWLPGAHRVMDARDLADLLPLPRPRAVWRAEVDSARSEA
ncbi:MAG: thiamine pyrophosphate-binding protein, partial [Citricoccus sp.]